jgi:mRNA interferase ChpB
VDRGDIYIVDLEPTKGREQRGQRPVLIVSQQKFNTLGVVWVVPFRWPVPAPIPKASPSATMCGLSICKSGRPDLKSGFPTMCWNLS